MASCPNLNEEDETEQNGYLVGSSEVGSKQVVRQRHRQDGSRHFFRNVCFFHKNLWSCKLYQAIESFLKIGLPLGYAASFAKKGTNKS